MKIDVYDTYATSKNGKTIHFDVFLPNGESKENAVKFARNFLKEIGESVDALKQERCNFCHSQSASEEIEKVIAESGHFILQMEGCPAPY
ncbi:MAG: DUF2024 family protein [Rickettsiales bacterium]|jgi:hypothetical protein